MFFNCTCLLILCQLDLGSTQTKSVLKLSNSSFKMASNFSCAPASNTNLTVRTSQNTFDETIQHQKGVGQVFRLSNLCLKQVHHQNLKEKPDNVKTLLEVVVVGLLHSRFFQPYPLCSIFLLVAVKMSVCRPVPLPSYNMHDLLFMNSYIKYQPIRQLTVHSRFFNIPRFGRLVADWSI